MATVRDAARAEIECIKTKRTCTAELPTVVVVPFLPIDPTLSYMLCATNWDEGEEPPGGHPPCDGWIREWGGVYKTAHRLLCEDFFIEDPCTPADADDSEQLTQPEIYQDPYAPGGEAETDPSYPSEPREIEITLTQYADCEEYVDGLQDYSGARKHCPHDYEHSAVKTDCLIHVELRAYRMRCARAGKAFTGDVLPRFTLEYYRGGGEADSPKSYRVQTTTDSHTYLLIVDALGASVRDLNDLSDDTLVRIAHAAICKEIGIPSGIQSQHDLTTTFSDNMNGSCAIHVFPKPSVDMPTGLLAALDQLCETHTGRRAVQINGDALWQLEEVAFVERQKLCHIVQW